MANNDSDSGASALGSSEVREAVRAVTRAVVGRLGHAGPEVVEAVVAEVLTTLARAPAAAAPAPAAVATTFTTPRGATLLPVLGGDGSPSFDSCSACIEQEKARTRKRAILTTTGKNQRGIVARVTTRIADFGGDILDISQTLIGDYFTMIIIVDTAQLSVPYQEFQQDLQTTIRDLGCQVMMMHEDVLSSFHRV